MLILVTGATGKVGRHFIAGLLDDPRFSNARIRALCHNRSCDETDHVEVVRGSIAERHVVAAAARRRHPFHASRHLQGNARDVMDVAVKRAFRILEVFRASPTARQFILVGGDDRG